MSLTLLPAHGALGNWDELIFLAVASALLILMVVSWLRARAGLTEEEENSASDQRPSRADARSGQVELE